MKLAITVCATGNYCYAMKTLARRVCANLVAAGWTEPGIAIIAGDKSTEVKDAVKHWVELLPKDWEVRLVLAGEEKDGAANYKTDAQMLIARLRSAAFAAARRWGADRCWSLDSDTLPPANALRCMEDMLRFDGGWYSVSTCPYPNELFLGGRGTPRNPIAQDFIEKERVLTDELKAESAAIKAEDEALAKEARETAPGSPTEPPEAWKARRDALQKRSEEFQKKVRECPPDGNIWQIIAKHGWRARGWLDFAYPGIGRGAALPSDWCGFGCTYMDDEALALADFEGYDGQGTEDLWVVWRKWHPAGLRINVITHCPCDHVIWDKKKGGDAKKYTLIRSYHEGEGECEGHLRTSKHAWTEF